MDLPCEVIPNAIDAQMFRFSEQVRREVREQYGLEDCLVVGHVGRLQYQKNQTFLLDAFRHLHEREEKARLVLVGDGPDLTELEAKAVTLGIEREVLFLGNRDDVNRLLQAFDLFVMPSHFEGFGMAALEAQAAGLPCLLSDSVPRETKLTRNVEFIPAEDPAIWAEHMLNMLERHEIRRDEAQTIADAGYDIGTAAQRLEDKLIALTERKRFQRRFLMTPKTSASGVPALNKARAPLKWGTRRSCSTRRTAQMAASGKLSKSAQRRLATGFARSTECGRATCCSCSTRISRSRAMAWRGWRCTCCAGRA